MTRAPSKELAAQQRRNARFGKLGLMSLSVSGLIGISFVLAAAVYYKLILFGPEVLFWSATGAPEVVQLIAHFAHFDPNVADLATGDPPQFFFLFPRLIYILDPGVQVPLHSFIPAFAGTVATNLFLFVGCG